MKATCVVDNLQHIKVMQFNKKKRAEQPKENKKETTTKTQEKVSLIMLGKIGLKNVQSLSTMVKPVTLACGHSGCRHCLATLVGIETFPKCPLCKAPIGTDVTLHVNVALDDIIGDFNVKCNKSGCLWKGKFHEHEQHLKRCGKFQTACANDGCGEMVARERMAAHTAQCAKHKLPCQQCGRKITRESFEEHTASLCSNKRVLCPLSCGTSLPRLHLTLHLSECSERAVRCAVTGCTAIIKQKNMPQHSTNAAATHSVLQEGEVQRLRGLMHFKRAKPRWILEERGVFSFRWRGEKWNNVKGSHLFSTEYRCPNGNRWRAHIRFAGLSLELVSAVTAVVVGTRIVLMPDSCEEKVFPFPAKEIKEGEVAANIPRCELDHMDPEDIMIVKFVLTYYLLQEDK